MIVTNLGLGNSTTFVYQFVIEKSNEHTVVITQFFIFNRLVPCVNFKADLAHMFYQWTLSHCADLPVMVQKGKHFLCVDYNTTIFAWGDL